MTYRLRVDELRFYPPEKHSNNEVKERIKLRLYAELLQDPWRGLRVSTQCMRWWKDLREHGYVDEGY